MLVEVLVQDAQDPITTDDFAFGDEEALPTNHNKATLTVWQVAFAE